MKITIAAFLLATIPCLTFAEDTVTAPATTQDASQVRFFPLDNARNNRPVAPHVLKPLRSDSSTMTGGFFRIDRSRTIPLNKGASTGPLIIRAQDQENQEVRIIRGAGPSEPPVPTAPLEPAITPAFANPSNDPVLSLFESNSAQPSSFRAALTGSSGQLLPGHQWPIPKGATQKVSSNYGFRADPFNKDTKFHGGIDIAAPIGTPVLASTNGQVASVGNEGGYGNTIVMLNDDGSESRYSHLNTVQATQGQRVRAGQTIGSVGTSGHSTGPHLDYRLSQDGVSIDPLKSGVADAQHPAADSAAIASTPKVTHLRDMQTAKTDRIIVVR